jgi:hypothetical protein
MADTELLKAAFSTNTRWAELSTIAVFFGLLGDIFVIFVFDMRDETKSRWEIGLAFAASLIIAVGVCGEWRFGHNASNASSQLQTKSDERIAELTREAATERQITAALESKTKGRTLTPEQRQVIARKCKSIAGRTVFITSYTGDVEALKLGLQIKAALELEPAKLRIVDGLWATQGTLGGVATGIEVTGPDRDVVNEIAKALTSIGGFVARPYVRQPQISVGSERAVDGIMIGANVSKR